ncbi:MAG: homoserine dehydrogenase, partial [Candidatus Omnitrophota bacterium]
MKEVKIGLIGLGTVGMGVYDAVGSNGKLIAERTGVSLMIKSVCDKDRKVLDSIEDKKGLIKTSDAKDIINDSDIDIIVELIGGVDPAKNIILDSLRNK